MKTISPIKSYRKPTTSYLFTCLIVFSFIPDIGIKFATFGFTWTVYRITIAISICAVLFLRAQINIMKRKMLTKWLLFQFVWVLYGGILLFVGKYTDFHNGFIEMLSVFNGLIVFYCMSIYLRSEENKEHAIATVFYLLNVFVLIGLIEIITGKHWITSAYNDTESAIFQYGNVHLATGLMYNMNDFSALITCMTPVLLSGKFRRKRIFTLSGVIIINLINDATMCNMAIIVFALFYFMILRGGKSQRAFVFRLLFWILTLGAFAFIIYSRDVLTNRTDVIGAIARQISNAQASTGSLYHRIIMYKDAIGALLVTGMMGMGPGGFPNYFSMNTSLSGLVNPHAMIIEVLTQYGIIIAFWFVWLLYRMYKEARKGYNFQKDSLMVENLMVIAFVIAYIICSFAPSAFIGYSYQWVLIAIMCSCLDKTYDFGGILNA